MLMWERHGGLRWADVDLDAGAVTIGSTRIRHGTTVDAFEKKTARGNRTIALGPAVTSGMRAWADNRPRTDCGSGRGGGMPTTISS
jgi:integrase